LQANTLVPQARIKSTQQCINVRDCMRRHKCTFNVSYKLHCGRHAGVTAHSRCNSSSAKQGQWEHSPWNSLVWCYAPQPHKWPTCIALAIA
jgi:hypothetical protein